MTACAPREPQLDESNKSATNALPSFEFAPGVRVVQRDRHSVQFGTDATRAGVVESEHAEQLAASLSQLCRGFSEAEFAASCQAAGLREPAAASLLGDLVDYGIVRRQRQRPVVVLGTSRLATMARTALADAGFFVRHPLPGEPETTYLAMNGGATPIILVDRLADSRELAPMLCELARTWVPISTVDATCIIGPAVIERRGPCPLCAELTRTDRDPAWHSVVKATSSTNQPGACASVAALHVAIAHLIVIAEALSQTPAPPGSPARRVRPGELLELDPYARPQRRVMDNHPRCPACFMSAGQRSQEYLDQNFVL